MLLSSNSQFHVFNVFSKEMLAKMMFMVVDYTLFILYRNHFSTVEIIEN